MSKLNAFLHPVEGPIQEKEIIISKRFLDENGKPVPFKIRSLTQDENERLMKKATKKKKVNGQEVEYRDDMQYSREIVLAATLEPDFSSEEMCKAYGVLDPSLVPSKMLMTGEYQRLVAAITDLSGLNDSEDVFESAKN